MTRIRILKKQLQIDVLVLGLLILVVLGGIAIQDFKSRSVYWFWYPLLSALFVGLYRIQHNGLHDYWQMITVNVGLIAVQLIILTTYFSLRAKRFINITRQLLGWGDILFFISIAFYLSVLNFVVFYVASLLIVLLSWTIWLAVSRQQNKQIPLAGIQSVLLMLFLTSDWLWLRFEATSDNWLLRIL